ncbi:hypothetical protein C8J57DRAFT_1414782, partial [Mycena rebaudengoi]
MKSKSNKLDPGYVIPFFLSFLFPLFLFPRYFRTVYYVRPSTVYPVLVLPVVLYYLSIIHPPFPPTFAHLWFSRTPSYSFYITYHAYCIYFLSLDHLSESSLKPKSIHTCSHRFMFWSFVFYLDSLLFTFVEFFY